MHGTFPELSNKGDFLNKKKKRTNLKLERDQANTVPKGWTQAETSQSSHTEQSYTTVGALGYAPDNTSIVQSPEWKIEGRALEHHATQEKEKHKQVPQEEIMTINTDSAQDRESGSIPSSDGEGLPTTSAAPPCISASFWDDLEKSLGTTYAEAPNETHERHSQQIQNGLNRLSSPSPVDDCPSKPILATNARCGGHNLDTPGESNLQTWANNSPRSLTAGPSPKRLKVVASEPVQNATGQSAVPTPLAKSTSVPSQEAQEEGLSNHDAVWFFDVLEAYHKSFLHPQKIQALHDTGLRSQAKHRFAIIFWEDTHFIFNASHNFCLDKSMLQKLRDPKRWIINVLSQTIVTNFSYSIANRTDRSCIWSALMDRVLYHLTRSGFTDASIVTSTSTNRETMLRIGEFFISRSNLTKVIKKYCTTSSR
mmetsp:Transcript_12666/g.22566  ORF Transcript_12666/g.22566 Transcript_12666/m.22566 type:complete len:424 (-) Transcript_12666:481-1752(-)